MKIEGIELLAREEDGTGWAINISWNQISDVLSIIWHKQVQTSGQTGRGTFYSLHTYEDLSNLTAIYRPGCVLNFVKVLTCIGGVVHGIQFCEASKLPLSPNGKTLLGYIDLLKKFPGFECVGDLVKTLGRGEDFLNGIYIHIAITRNNSTEAA